MIILFLIKFDFEDIVGMTNALAAFYQLLIIGAFIKLRYSHPDVDRPYKGTLRHSGGCSLGAKKQNKADVTRVFAQCLATCACSSWRW